MNLKKTFSIAAAVSIIALQLVLLLQGCSTPVPARSSLGPGVHPGIIILTAQQADELGIRVRGRQGQGGAEPQAERAQSQRNQQQGKGSTALTKAPVIRAYQVARYRDPADPRVMHEAHTVYRIEEDGDWVLNETDKDTQAR